MDGESESEGNSEEDLAKGEQLLDEEEERASLNLVTPARRTIPAADFTPYSPRPNSKDPSKSRWTDQSPDTQLVLNLGSQLYVSDLMGSNPYPDEPTRVKLSNTQLLRAAELLGLSRRHARLKGTTSICETVQKWYAKFLVGNWFCPADKRN